MESEMKRPNRKEYKTALEYDAAMERYADWAEADRRELKAMLEFVIAEHNNGNLTMIEYMSPKAGDHYTLVFKQSKVKLYEKTERR